MLTEGNGLGGGLFSRRANPFMYSTPLPVSRTIRMSVRGPSVTSFDVPFESEMRTTTDIGLTRDHNGDTRCTPCNHYARGHDRSKLSATYK